MSEDRIPAVNLPKEAARIPNGYIEENGQTLYIDGNGDKFSREHYQRVHGIDPEPYVAKMRAIPPIHIGSVGK